VQAASGIRASARYQSVERHSRPARFAPWVPNTKNAPRRRRRRAVTIESQLDQTSAATVSKMLRESLEIRFDALDEFEDGALVEHPPWYIKEKPEPVQCAS
jgi:hypothetical protein